MKEAFGDGLRRLQESCEEVDGVKPLISFAVNDFLSINFDFGEIRENLVLTCFNAVLTLLVCTLIVLMKNLVVGRKSYCSVSTLTLLQMIGLQRGSKML